tara:strand:- start:70 stop:438 length:369 start_codon:yes stop_codon:yes gene_type:complete
MLTESNRIIFFLLGCIGSRLILAVLPLYLSKEWLKYFGIIILIIALSFLYLYFTNGRLKAPEGGGNTWWAKFRLIHGLLYLTAAIYLFQKERLASIPLFIDVILGLILFILNKLDCKNIKLK